MTKDLDATLTGAPLGAGRRLMRTSKTLVSLPSPTARPPMTDDLLTSDEVRAILRIERTALGRAHERRAK
jgi:hypothetical protein